MSPSSHRQLLVALLAFVAAIALILRAMGPLEPPSVTIAALPAPKAAPIPLDPKTIAPKNIAPEPLAPVAQLDELADFSPCPGEDPKNSGSASLTNWRTHYDAEGRLVILTAYEGSLGTARVWQDLKTSRPVTALDFHGSYRWDKLRLDVNVAPVRVVHLGRHPGFTRLSVNYYDRNPPRLVIPEILCRPGDTGGLLAVRLTFQPSLSQSVSLARDY